jgi:hypothetical protein
LARPIVGIAASRSRRGYWLVGSDGGVFTFGDAGFFGSLGGVKLARPIVGIAASRTGRGYWLIASDGGVFTFGDAGFFGSLGGVKLARPIAGIAASRTGHGYWLIGSDGGVFTFGDAGLPGASSLYPNFKPPVPGAPIIRATLDDTGLHFNPSHIECGVYNVAFSDTRSDRIPGTEVALHFYVDNVYVTLLSVHAGETGGGLLGFGAVGWAATVDGIAVSGSSQLIIDPPTDPTAACATPVT